MVRTFNDVGCIIFGVSIFLTDQCVLFIVDVGIATGLPLVMRKLTSCKKQKT